MREIIRRHRISFKNAFAGLFWALTSQPNFRIHLTLAAAAVILGLYLGISRIEMALIVFAISLGLTAEMINTSLEAMCDLITHEWRTEAKIAKDVSAGMMLIAAIATVTVAFFVFWPYFRLKFSG